MSSKKIILRCYDSNGTTTKVKIASSENIRELKDLFLNKFPDVEKDRKIFISTKVDISKETYEDIAKVSTVNACIFVDVGHFNGS